MISLRLVPTSLRRSALRNILGAAVLEASIGFAFAQNEYLAGDSEAALRLIDDVLADYPSRNSAGMVPGIAFGLADKAMYLIALDRCDEARVQAQEALARARALQLAFVIVRSLQYLAVAALA